ncbi:CUN088 putative lef-5 late expression factor, similar to AcMNPV ORF99 [Culex nigripalpus nucleopolyhedrovirus]|uniref:CUN088 putative lef-5 late expression factor, similar to AcMNPV ORF99 n=1 Tax=Culex nigripalpus nucleopolyhedrovirus (isolate Florida/1997) TaxID=645993 RepID=Q919I9_NPVCO|nr:CUN088 putative lef-5 late expression factor, similar to AcMNPV ORF99 [Culex nigripalpus nucleopolyhedrovirus]AAK94166.1 CUN088 putative lef-5 late expression factor, similar to AcMNPV ORF99 [Culex nigripalpus nucleopolyhedrovirus]
MAVECGSEAVNAVPADHDDFQRWMACETLMDKHRILLQLMDTKPDGIERLCAVLRRYARTSPDKKDPMTIPTSAEDHTLHPLYGFNPSQKGKRCINLNPDKVRAMIANCETAIMFYRSVYDLGVNSCACLYAQQDHELRQAKEEARLKRSFNEHIKDRNNSSPGSSSGLVDFFKLNKRCVQRGPKFMTTQVPIVRTRASNITIEPLKREERARFIEAGRPRLGYSDEIVTCKHENTEQISVQQRSGDEAATIYVRCIDCKYISKQT